jgi:hypothetical protein
MSTRPSASRSSRGSPNVRGTLKREIIRCLKRYVAGEAHLQKVTTILFGLLVLIAGLIVVSWG